MKLLITMLLTALLLFSCKKEVVTTPQVTSEAVLAINNIKYDYPVQNFLYNPCTNEYISMYGNAHYDITWKFTATEVSYDYHASYESVGALGQTSGTKYNITGNQTAHFTATLTGDIFTPSVSQITGHIQFHTKGQDNDLASSVKVHLVLDNNGVPSLDQQDFKLDYCK